MKGSYDVARMLPDFIDPSIVASERRVFEALRAATNSENWVILHSLGLSSNWSGEFGEIDFVVIMAGVGIVCVEVKGGDVALRNGVWTTRNRRGTVEILRKSPYRQAQDGMWKLLNAIKVRFGPNSPEAKCPLGWLVAFPDIKCPPLTPEATRDEIIDRDDIDSDLGPRIAAAPSLVRVSLRTGTPKPSASTCSRIVNFLRPDFERVAAPVSNDWEAEARILALTEEQFDALDSIADNRVSLLQGPAGTGKTLLGIESARRAAAAGQDVLVLCFNQNLGNWLAAAVAGFKPGHVVAGNVHALLRERVLRSSLADELVRAESSDMDRSELLGDLYYELGALAVEESEERFDNIVFDEVQDIPAKRAGELVQAWSRDQQKSNILLLGDFTRQAIYTGSSMTSVARIRAAINGVAVFSLHLNCRNTRRIALQTGILTGFGEHRVSDRQPEGEQVSLQYHPDRATGLIHLDRIIRVLREAGQKASDVVILGPRRRENSLLGDRTSIGGWSLRDLPDVNSGDLAYSTIHAFKGLERPIVIIVDAEGASKEDSDSLLYIGMSRARLRLFILAPETTRALNEQRMAAAAVAAASGLKTS
jgi:KaiC/GvpD/RAD55 family RecA-like ATPase